MALKALDVYNHLPKTNCAKCGHPTCLAFAMQLAAKKASLDQCPDITAEALAALEGASQPPVCLVTIGKGDGAVKVGNETVLFRHDETFYHPAGIGVRLKDDLADDALQASADAIKTLSFERVGQKIAVDIIAVDNVSGDPAKFAKAAEIACKTGLAVVLMSENVGALSAAAEVCADQRPLLYKANASNVDEIAALAKAKNLPVVVDASDLDAAAQLTQKLSGAGVKEMILDVSSPDVSKTLQALTKVRRLAIKKNFRALGYPCMAMPSSQDPNLAAAEAGMFVAKYAGVVVVDSAEPWRILPLLTVRQNIYTDPRKPVQVEPGLYHVGSVDEKSPLLLTTNFSLTYYTVEGDVEASRVPSYIAVIDTEGTSVLTAWASEKLTTEKIAKFLNSEEVTGKVSHRKVVIPGYVSVMSGSLEDESGWKALVGPRESSGIPKYLKTMWKDD